MLAKIIDKLNLTEPSSWASLAAAAGTIGVSTDSEYLKGLTLVLAGLCACLGVYLKEKANKKK